MLSLYIMFTGQRESAGALLVQILVISCHRIHPIIIETFTQLTYWANFWLNNLTRKGRIFPSLHFYGLF